MKLQDLKQYGVTRSAPRVAPGPRNRIEDLLGGEIVGLAGGSCFYREESYPDGYQHGAHVVRDVASVSGHRLGVISRDSELAYADVAQAVFLDTETTGLSMGVGTYVFLVGAGYLDGGSFRVRQYFLSSPGEEVSFLTALHSFLGQFAAIVTFNGKAFDWPLLESRFARHRRPAPLDDPLHVDLLHPARRLWKRRLESCALSSLERHVLGVLRTREDVPGYEIPYRYFLYQRQGDAAGLEGVFYHNLQDILSLATLTVRIDRVLEDPWSGLIQDGLDFFCLGRIHERAGDGEMALMCYEEALRRQLEPEYRRDCLMHLATLQKRQRWYEGAIQTWDRLLDEGGSWALFALTEMAKYYEHVERDFAQALDAVQHALTLLELQPIPPPEQEVADLQHRFARLLNRSRGSRGWARSRA